MRVGDEGFARTHLKEDPCVGSQDQTPETDKFPSTGAPSPHKIQWWTPKSDPKERADIMFAKNWLGHKNIQSTVVYSQLASRTRDE